MSGTESAARRKRVNRLKKLIILFLITLIAVPIILCVLLFVRVISLEDELKRMNTQIEQIVLEQNRLKEASNDEFAMNPAQAFEEENADEVIDEYEISPKEEKEGTVDDTVVVAQSSLTMKDTSETDTEQKSGQEDVIDPEQDETLIKVYLTFDDGPTENTDAILDILAKYNVKATFFVIGHEGEEAQARMRRIVAEGHTIGMHTYSHRYSQIYASVEAFGADVIRLQQYIYDVTGVESRYFRFPGGSSNEVTETDIMKLISWVQEKGISYYDWNISGNDAGTREISAAEIVENCMRDIGRYGTNIVLLHDSADKDATVEALPILLEKILAMENTVILPITDSTKPIQHITIKETEE